MNTWAKFLAPLVIVLLLIMGVALVLHGSKKSAPQVSLTSQTSAGWVVYRDQNISFHYPISWQFSAVRLDLRTVPATTSARTATTSASLSFQSGKLLDTFGQQINSATIGDGTTIVQFPKPATKTTIGRTDALLYTSEKSNGPITLLFLPTNSQPATYYELTFNQGNTDTFRQVISSLTLINEN